MADPEQDPDTWIDRPVGILTPRERELLIETGDLADEDETRAAERQRRSRIRKRLIHSLLDFAILNPPPKAILDIFEDIDSAIDEEGKRYPRELGEAVQDDDSPTLRDGINGLIEFLVYALDGVRPAPNGRFDECLSSGVKTAFIRTLAESGVSLVPEVRLEREFDDAIEIEKVREQLQEGKLLLPEEYEALLQAYPEDRELIREGMDQWRNELLEAIMNDDMEWRDRHRQRRKEWRSEASEISLTGSTVNADYA